MVITQFSGIVNEYLMVYPLGVDVFSRKKHEKELQKAARCAVIFMCNVSTNNLRACEAF